MYQISKLLFAPIDERWHPELLRFIDTGDASEEFLNFLDSDAECQRVVELALVIVGKDFERSARQLENSGGIRELPDSTEMATTFGRVLSSILAAFVELTDDQQKAVLDFVACRFDASVHPPLRQHLLHFATGIAAICSNEYPLMIDADATAH